MSREIRAVLFNVKRNASTITGNVYCDRRGEFEDGEIITTSTVVEELRKVAGVTVNLIITKNSIYKVASWA